MPLYAHGANAELVRGLADNLDLVYDEQGRPVAGSGRNYTDQAELGDFLQEQMNLGAGVPAGEDSALGV